MIRIKVLLSSIVAASFVFAACDPAEGLPDGNGLTSKPPYYKDYPLDLGYMSAEASPAGVTVKVKHVEEQNFIFELRPGAKVQSFKFDVYPAARLFNNLLNDKDAGNLAVGDKLGVTERIRSYLFTDGSGGFAISAKDFKNPEDFLQLEYDWMSTDFSANATVIPDCGFIIAVVSSLESEISSVNQEELTLCYLRTPSKPLIGDPTVAIEVTTGYRAFGVNHVPNVDAAGVYYFGGFTGEIDAYIDAFGDKMFRDLVRSFSLISSDNTEGLYYSYNYGEAADHNIKSTTVAVCVDANLTPQEDYVRRDFTLDEMPPEEEQPYGVPIITIIEDRIAASYFEFEVVIPKECNTIFYGFYTEEEKLALEASEIARKKETVRLVKEGYGRHNENFAWVKENPEGEEATGTSQTVRLDGFEEKFVAGENAYVGITGRNGYGTPGPLTFSDPVRLDERNMSAPGSDSFSSLDFYITDITRTSFRMNFKYDPSKISVMHFQYIPKTIEVDKDVFKPWQEAIGLTTDSPWEDWVDLIITKNGVIPPNINLNVNHWEANEINGYDDWVWTGMIPGMEYTMFLIAEDYDGNLSKVYFEPVLTKDAQVGPNPTVKIENKLTEDGWTIAFTMEKDVKSFKYAVTDKISDLKIPGANQGHLDNIAESGIGYEKWSDAIYEWISVSGMETFYESVAPEYQSSGVQIAACLAEGQDEDGNPVFKMYHMICKDGEGQTLEEIFGKTEE